MFKPTIQSGFWGGLPFPEFKRPVLICHDGFCPKVFNENKDSFKVFIQGCEPVQAFYLSHPNFDKNILKEFDLVLYHDSTFALGKINKVFPFGTCRISDKFKKNATNYEVSFICGTKNYLPGHNLRHEVYERLSEIKNLSIKAYFTFPAGTPGGCKPKDDIFSTSQFSIVIENHRNENYFTEKLIDCLVAETIPLYWGCSNIDEYFDKQGIIKFNDANDLFTKLKLITPELYNSKRDIIKNNKEKALQYAGNFETSPQFYVDRVAREVNSLL